MNLSAGTLFIYSASGFPDKPAHPKIVISSTDRGRIIYVYTSTKEESVRRQCQRTERKLPNQPLVTMVSAPISECEALDEDSWINCNNAIDIDEYVLRHHGSFSLIKGIYVSQQLLRQIMVGIISSPKVSEENKAVIRKTLISKP
jgi:hypothetical protein